GWMSPACSTVPEPIDMKTSTLATTAGAGAPASSTGGSWAPPASTDVRAGKPWQERLLPAVGPVALLIIWDLVVRSGLIKPILLPGPWHTLVTQAGGLAGVELKHDFGVTGLPTLTSVAIAAVLGMALSIALGSNEKAYRSV